MYLLKTKDKYKEIILYLIINIKIINSYIGSQRKNKKIYRKRNEQTKWKRNNRNRRENNGINKKNGSSYNGKV